MSKAYHSEHVKACNSPCSQPNKRALCVKNLCTPVSTYNLSPFQQHAVRTNQIVSLACSCLRQKNVAQQHAQMMDYFGPTCTPDTDQESVKQMMGNKWQPVDWSCIGSAQQMQVQQKQEQQYQQSVTRAPPPPHLKYASLLLSCDHLCRPFWTCVCVLLHLGLPGGCCQLLAVSSMYARLWIPALCMYAATLPC